jgi:hypothetical protein
MVGRAAGVLASAIAVVVLASCGAVVVQERRAGDADPPQRTATTWSPPTTRLPSPPASRPPLTTRPTPPTITLDCGPPVRGTWDWYEVEFGYWFRMSSPVVEIGIDYGDGNGYVTADASDAEENSFWHRYHAPGNYPVRAWITDANGLTSETACTFAWLGAGLPPSSGGDLDCVDIGFEHPTPPGDPHGLDADGDGVACEGW